MENAPAMIVGNKIRSQNFEAFSSQAIVFLVYQPRECAHEGNLC